MIRPALRLLRSLQVARKLTEPSPLWNDGAAAWSFPSGASARGGGGGESGASAGDAGGATGPPRPRRFAVLETGHASPYTTGKYGGYPKMLIDLLGDPGEEWEVFSVVEGAFPSADQLDSFDGFVMTGSKHDAHGPEEWITCLCDTLRAIHEKRRKVLGVCFGHQVLSRALGGKTGRSDRGWQLGVKEVPVTAELAAKPYAAGLPPVVRILKTHQDQVYEVPPDGNLLASSRETGVEIFTVGDTMLGIQGHPEYTKDVVEDLIASRLELGLISEDVAEKGRQSMRELTEDKEALQRLCKAFLKGPPA